MTIAGLARVADYFGHAARRRRYLYGLAPFRHMMEARSVDIVMIDLLRVGGIAQLDEGCRRWPGLSTFPWSVICCRKFMCIWCRRA